MTAVILDAGPLVAVDRGDRRLLRRLRAAVEEGFALRTHAMVVGQVWRDPHGRQASLAKLLRGVDVVVIDEAFGRRAGELCGASGVADPIDAGLALLATTGDLIMTGHAEDMAVLLQAAGTSARVVAL